MIDYILTVRLAALALVLACPAPLLAQGPVIPSAGTFRPVPGLSYGPDRTIEHRFSMDVTDSAAAGERNPGFVRLATLYNQLVSEGVPADRVRFALVVHGRATFDLMTNAAYRARLGSDNPNVQLLAELDRAGVQVIVCGQALLNRKVDPATLLPFVKVASSAVTAHAALLAKGYSRLD
jgi:intracellular sulfur oxidation DsrE/DsrF family protein